jgi:hypothetical protein
VTEPEMSQQAREILKRYRSAESLGSEARARVLTGLRAKIATGTPALGATKASLLSKVASAGKTKLILGALAVAVPAAWTIHRSQSSVDYTLRTATPEVPAAPAVTAPAVAAQPESARAPKALGDEPYRSAATSDVDVAPEVAASETEGAPSEARSATKRSAGAQRAQGATANTGVTPKAVVLEESPEEAPAPAAPASTLDQEMQLLKRAQVAQASGRSSDALSILAEHAKQFPNGKLAESREVARVIALCQSGQTQAARSARDRFLATRPNSPFASRVRSVCAEK